MSSSIFTPEWNVLNTEERAQYFRDLVFGVELFVVCLDDEPDILELTKHEIQRLGLSVFSTSSHKDAFDFIQNNSQRVVLILSDYMMPEVNGIEFRKSILKIAPEIPFAIISGYVDREMALSGIENKIAAFAEKPLSNEMLIKLICRESELRIQNIKDDRELVKGFTDEATRLIEQIEELILELDEDPTKHEHVSAIFAMAHTIKGTSGFFTPNTLSKFVHFFEDTIKAVQSGEKSLSPLLITSWLKSCDIIKEFISEHITGNYAKRDLQELIQSIATQQAAAQDTFKKELKSNTKIDTNNTVHTKKPNDIKVSIELLNEFMAISGEMTVVRNMINKVVRSIEKQYSSDKDVLQLSDLLEELHKINGQVQNKITDLRKVPVKNILKPIHRIFRDTSRALEKEAQLVVHGEELCVDTSIAEVLSDSFAHLIRNSLDHGLELPAQREADGKSRKGQVDIFNRVIDDNIVVEITDDGRGINVEAVKSKAVQSGLCTSEEVEKLTESEIYLKIFEPGFSTAQKVTDVSGRGVGMSAVKEAVEAIGGKIHITSQMGFGTSFTLIMPIPKSVLITNCLFVSSGPKQTGIQQEHIRRVVQVQEQNFSEYLMEIEGGYVFKLEDQLLPLIDLNQIFNFSENIQFEEHFHVLILKTKSCEFALKVEKVFDLEDSVVKALQLGSIKTLGIYLGGTFLSDGSVGLILNIEGIAQKYKLNQSQNKNKSDEKLEFFTESKKLSEYVLFELDLEGVFAVRKDEIFRFEEIYLNKLQNNCGLLSCSYREKILNLIDIHHVIGKNLNLETKSFDYDPMNVLVMQNEPLFIGFQVKRILDMITTDREIEQGLHQERGISGHLLIDDKAITVLNTQEIIDSYKDLFKQERDKNKQESALENKETPSDNEDQAA